MQWFAAGLVLGTLPLAHLAALPPTSLGWSLLLSIVLLRWRRGRFVAGACIGFALALLAAHDTMTPRLDHGLEGQDLVVTGQVTGLPQTGARRTRLRLRVLTAERDGQSVTVPSLVRLNWYDDAPTLRVGERWRLRVRLERAHGFANPGTFDYARWLFREGIGATGYVRDASTAVRIAPGGPSLDRFRQQLRRALRVLLPDGSAGGILMALALGERGDIASADWSVLRATGTTHLVAISGLHIGLMALAGFWLGRGIWLALGRRRVRVARPLCQAWTGLLAATAYAALAGFALPTVRALLMLAVALAGVVLRRRARPAEALATAAVAVVLFDPLAPLGASFWLSFAAVAVILLLVTGRIAPAGRWRRWLGLQLGIGVALAPLLILFFAQASRIAPLANLIAIPWVSLLVVPPTLVGVALVPIWSAGAGALFALAAAILAPLWHLLTLLAGWGPAQWYAPQPPWMLVALAAAGGAVLVLPRGVPGRMAGLMALVTLCLWRPAGPIAGAVRLELLDVGQGLAAVVRTQHHVLVYDTGPRFSADFDAGSAVVVPFLRARGIERIDGLVLSHLDNDHAGGRAAVRRVMRPRRLWTSAPQAIDGPARLCARGHEWRWDGVRFRFLHPDPDDGVRGNNASCVLRIDAPGGSILLPGDIEAETEQRLLARDAPLAADVVVAPHHGSATSSTRAFVRAVDPQVVLYAVGYHNRWDFPRPGVVARWRPAAGRRTDCAGAIGLRLDPGRGVSAPHGWRQQAPHFWYAGCARSDKSGTMRAVDAGAASGG